MATLQVSTVSNTPTVDPDRVDELRSFLDEWLLGTGPFDTLTVDVFEPDRDLETGERPPSYLVLYGYASFGPAHRPTVRDTAREQLDAAGDLKGLSDDERERLTDAETEEFVYDYPVLFGAIHRLPRTADCRSIGVVVRLIGPIWLGIVYRA